MGMWTRSLGAMVHEQSAFGRNGHLFMILVFYTKHAFQIHTFEKKDSLDLGGIQETLERKKEVLCNW